MQWWELGWGRFGQVATLHRVGYGDLAAGTGSGIERGSRVQSRLRNTARQPQPMAAQPFQSTVPCRAGWLQGSGSGRLVGDTQLQAHGRDPSTTDRRQVIAARGLLLNVRCLHQVRALSPLPALEVELLRPTL